MKICRDIIAPDNLHVDAHFEILEYLKIHSPSLAKMMVLQHLMVDDLAPIARAKYDAVDALLEENGYTKGVTITREQFVKKRRELERPKIHQAKNILESAQKDERFDRCDQNCNFTPVAIQTTLRRIENELNHASVAELSPQSYKRFLFRTHQLLTGRTQGVKSKENIKKILDEELQQQQNCVLTTQLLNQNEEECQSLPVVGQVIDINVPKDEFKAKLKPLKFIFNKITSRLAVFGGLFCLLFTPSPVLQTTQSDINLFQPNPMTETPSVIISPPKYDHSHLKLNLDNGRNFAPAIISKMSSVPHAGELPRVIRQVPSIMKPALSPLEYYKLSVASLGIHSGVRGVTAQSGRFNDTFSLAPTIQVRVPSSGRRGYSQIDRGNTPYGASNDKWLHYGLGYAFGGVVSTITENKGLGCLASLVLGVGKEVYDSTGRGNVEALDVAATALQPCVDVFNANNNSNVDLLFTVGRDGRFETGFKLKF